VATDPVCGMAVDERTSELLLVRENRTYYFCSPSCLETFSAPHEEQERVLHRLLLAWPLALLIVVLGYLFHGLAGEAPSLVFASAVQFYAGWPFYEGAWAAVKGRQGNMDLLIASGTSAAFFYSLAVVLAPGRLPSATFFDASSLIIALILTGNYLEQRTRARASSALRRLGELLPTEVRKLVGGEERTVPVSEVRPGDRLRIPPAGRFPVDGRVVDGRTSVDEAILTGEPLPVARGPGDRLLAGSRNLEGAVTIEATGTGPDTFVAQIGHLLTEAELARMPLRRTADRLAAGFVPVVLVLAIAASGAWVAFGRASLPVGILIFVTVAITACPCAFGLATPAALAVGTGRAAEEGILFRGGDAIERTARVDLVLCDKTGTLTSARPEVGSVRAVPPYSESDLLALAAGLESGVSHPLADAVLARARAARVLPRRFEEVTLDPGRGVRGRVGSQRTELLRRDAASGTGVSLAPLGGWTRSVEATGESWSVVIEGGRLVGGISFRSPLVPEAREAVDALRSEGIDVGVVTGDHELAARPVATALGVQVVHAGVTPQGKVDIVKRYRAEGRTVAFVGDGVNDAPALAEADLGIALGSGTDVTREVGQVLLVRNDLRAVPRAVAYARQTVRRVHQNLVWALGYNAVLLPIAAGALVPWLGFGVYGWLPILGAIAMALSSTTVVLGSLLLRIPPRAADPGRPTAGADPARALAGKSF
jgi:P-type Cu+ transporter